MLDDTNPRAVPGNNNPPPYRVEVAQAHNEKAKEFLDAAGDWLDRKEIENEEQAGQLVDFLDGLRKRFKMADEDRKADKKPHDDAGKAVQAAYAPILEKITKAADRVKPMQSRWLLKVEAERKAEAERQQAEARRKAEEAERQAAAAASRNDLDAEIDAEAARKEAEKAQKDADRLAKSKVNARSASGGGRTQGLRTYVHTKLKNPRLAFMHYQDHPGLHDALTQLAQQEVRSADFDPKTDKIPGFDITIERK